MLREQPLPEGPWILHQTWTEVLFAHWRVTPGVVRPLVPEPLELELREGSAWLSVLAFRMSGVRPRGTPRAAGLALTWPPRSVA